MCCMHGLYYMRRLAIVALMSEILPMADNPALRTVSKDIPADQVRSAHIIKLLADMKELLAKEEHGVALAAVQVGEPVRLFIVSGRALARGRRNAPDEPEGKNKEVRIENKAEMGDQIYINPVVVKLSRGRELKHEGCLSIKGKWGEVPRAEKATLRYLDESGKAHERGASGFLAHIFQHEMDHLDGILYIDKAEKLYDEIDEKK